MKITQKELVRLREIVENRDGADLSKMTVNFGCHGCSGNCLGSCSNSCQGGCSMGCRGSCWNGCQTSCRYACQSGGGQMNSRW